LLGRQDRSRAHLARGQDTVHLSHDGLITAQIRLGIENKADVETEVVPLIFSHKFDRKPEHFVVPRGASHESTAEGALRNDVLGHILKVEECAVGRGERAFLRGDLDAGL
jgi:hypothetical protein